jgi:hypothetical protein
MSTIMAKLQARRIGERTHRIIVVAADEDTPTAARVTEFCRELTWELGGGWEIIKQAWLVNLLRRPQLRAIAAEDAAAADLVVLSFHDNHDLPEEVKAWIEQWVQYPRHRPLALLTLFDTTQPTGHNALHQYLEMVARRGKLELVSQGSEAAEEYR